MSKHLSGVLSGGFSDRVFWNMQGYGHVLPIKTVFVGVPLDLSIPCTFGGITFLLKRFFGDIIFRVDLEKIKGWIGYGSS